MPIRHLVLGVVALLIFCWFFVESPAPRFQPGDVVAADGRPERLMMIVSAHTPIPILACSGGRLKLVEWEYIAVTYNLPFATYIVESSLDPADPAIVAEVLQAHSMHRKLAAFAWDY